MSSNSSSSASRMYVTSSSQGGRGQGAGEAVPATTSRIRKRSVSFGNPALWTYQGTVVLWEGPPSLPLSHRPNANNSVTRIPLVEGAIETNGRLVAIVDVPPEQVPEGILNLARPYRPWIDHLRIVINEPTTTTTQDNNNNDSSNNNIDDARLDENGREQESSTTAPDGGEPINTPFSVEWSPNTSAMESAASILAAEQQRMLQLRDQPQLLLPPPEAIIMDRPTRTYTVLIELCSEEMAHQMVEDLDEKPYTYLDESQRCTIRHVLALQGEDGVSLMSPFFAPATKPSSTSSRSGSGGIVEIVPLASSSLTTRDQDHHHASANHHPYGSSNNDTTTNVDRGSDTTENDGGEGGEMHNSAAPLYTEDYNCAVCLEHMELNNRPLPPSTSNSTGEQPPRTAILTTVCNHTFHLDCIMQCQDSPCPVCRYDHSGLNEALSQCHICGTTDNNYVCLICGVVSCVGRRGGGGGPQHPQSQLPVTGRTTIGSSTGGSNSNRQEVGFGECESTVSNPTRNQPNPDENVEASQQRMSTSHARKHYDETLHAYALDTETQHVWDFAGQGYVHRLLQNKEDGKLVEVNDPHNTSSNERTLNPGLSEQQEGEVVHRKLEGFANQYYTLLKSQLEQQRVYYEGRLQEIRREYTECASSSGNGRSRGNNNSSSSSHKPKRRSSDLIAALKQERHQLSQRLTSLQNRCAKIQGDVMFLKDMNESLEANKVPLKTQIDEAQREWAEVNAMFAELLPPLQEKVTRLMLQLESEYNGEDMNGKGSCPI